MNLRATVVERASARIFAEDGESSQEVNTPFQRVSPGKCRTMGLEGMRGFQHSAQEVYIVHAFTTLCPKEQAVGDCMNCVEEGLSIFQKSLP